MIAILDYGSGNLHSAYRAFAQAHPDVIVTNDPDICSSADGLVVPGVGAYAACMDQLFAAGAEKIIANRVASARPLFGICVGMQIFFTEGKEKAATKGLGIWRGSVERLNSPILPHMGWNTVTSAPGSRLFSGVEDEHFYFVHSYGARVDVPNALNTICEYGGGFLAAVEAPHVVATQFHPEKSGAAGATLIRNWVDGWVAA